MREGGRFITYVVYRSQQAQVDIRSVPRGIKAEESARIRAGIDDRSILQDYCRRMAPGINLNSKNWPLRWHLPGN
jgi:hypothetical protein